MVITCDASCSMAYVYLMEKYSFKYDERDKREIEKYINKDKINISYIENNCINSYINRLRICKKTYAKALDEGEIDEEFRNDRDSNGYLKGIELRLSKKKFISMIEKQVFKVYGTYFNSSNYNVLLFDEIDEVFRAKNILYPMNKNLDSFVICSIQGIHNIVYIKGVISSREDLYDLNYLLTPEFILRDGETKQSLTFEKINDNINTI